MNEIILTIGHSTHPLNHFIALLRKHQVTALCDVRSQPYSRRNPQFNRESLKESLRESGIVYLFLGEALGGRSKDPSCIIDGKVHYDLIAQSSLFRKGLERLREEMKHHQLALMCAEKNPIVCHRTILVARHLDAMGITVKHILEDGSAMAQIDIIARLIRQLNLPEFDMFRSQEDIIHDAYRIQGERIAYEENDRPDKSAGPTTRA